MFLLPVTLLSSLPALAESPRTALAPTALEPGLPLPAAVRDALWARDHAAAVAALAAIDSRGWTEAQQADLAFLRAWELQRADRAAEALPLLDAVRRAEGPPPAYVDLVVGELLVEAGRPVEALPVLERIPARDPIHARARLALADAYDHADRTADARTVLEEIAGRDHPVEGGAQALWALARRTGQGDPRSLEWVRRIYRHYPGSPEDRESQAWLGTPSLEDLALRGDLLQERGLWETAATLLATRLAEAPADACRYRFAYGRAQHKRNNLSAAAEVLAPLGPACRGKDDDRGAKALYLAGKSLERKKDWAGAARQYLAIPELYPEHSMADDGYALGGIALQEAGDLAGARRVWALGMEHYREGDLAAENAWRLAWGAWLADDVGEALRWADKASAELALASAPTDVLAARYWAGRWRVWPDRRDGRRQNPDAAERARGEALLRELAAAAPWHWYGLLAAQRVRLLDPAASFTRPEMDPEAVPWRLRDPFVQDPAVQAALRLSRVGLGREAMAELAILPDETLEGGEMAVVTQLQAAAGDFVGAHDRLRSYMKSHPPDSLGPQPYKVMRAAWPERYWTEIQAATRPYGWDARLFHALVREESNFNPKIKSHAGACGLSQLMPATAADTAKRMGLAWSSSKIWDVPTNLQIGGYYLDMLVRQYKGNAALALAAYNAGGGNVSRWLGENPADSPTDALVEAIDFRETRHYVKRVSSTWMTYRLLYGAGELYPGDNSWALDAVP